MTPAERAVSGTRRWFKRLIDDTDFTASELRRILDAPPEAFSITSRQEELDGIVRRLQKSAKRCAHHGLGISVQTLLPLKLKEENGQKQSTSTDSVL